MSAAVGWRCGARFEQERNVMKTVLGERIRGQDTRKLTILMVDDAILVGYLNVDMCASMLLIWAMIF